MWSPQSQLTHPLACTPSAPSLPLWSEVLGKYFHFPRTSLRFIKSTELVVGKSSGWWSSEYSCCSPHSLQQDWLVGARLQPQPQLATTTLFSLLSSGCCWGLKLTPTTTLLLNISREKTPSELQVNSRGNIFSKLHHSSSLFVHYSFK